ncbi:MAG TPA: beta-ketoacyl-[acyl-carrier-protein] synthase II, partial [Candidatus Binatia bacterium]
HTQGACGAIETVAAVMSIHKKTILQSINCDALDPGCLIRVHREKRTQGNIRALLLNTFGFGGKNATLILCPFGTDTRAI